MVLSIVIPSYNHAHFVLSTIKAAAGIDIHDKEIIVIDDGSTDNSVAVIQKYIEDAHPDINIRLISRENRGLVRTLNEGLSIALGKYFYVVASDDIPISEGIVRLVNLLGENDEFHFAMGNALVMRAEQQRGLMPTYRSTHARFFALEADLRRKAMFMNYPNPLLLQATVFRTSTLMDIGGWREDILLDDFSLFVRLLSQFPQMGRHFLYKPDIMVCLYRQHTSNSYRDSMRQLMLVEQSLTLLCPPEWRTEAIARKYAYYGQVSLRNGRLREVADLFQSMVTRMGVLRSIHASVCELTSIIGNKLRDKYSFTSTALPDSATKNMDGVK
jgi:glycosyltransferase involved in cell wall biosynthesis